jgi:hypothetical protein
MLTPALWLQPMMASAIRSTLGGAAALGVKPGEGQNAVVNTGVLGKLMQHPDMRPDYLMVI